MRRWRITVSINDLCKLSLDVQMACNLSGVVHSFQVVLTKLWAYANENKKGTDWVNQHPISVLFVDKIADLTGIDHSNHAEPFHTAYNWASDRMNNSEITEWDY